MPNRHKQTGQRKRKNPLLLIHRYPAAAMDFIFQQE
jgi:hypothetical protein